MVHPRLAAGDPLYWFSLLILAATVPALVAAVRVPHLRVPVILIVLVLAPLSGCYAMLGTACYGFGDCP